jgi:dephospho-CoA kinase
MHFALGGHLGSGKSTLAKALAADIGVACVAFGDYVRELADQAGVNRDERSNLQNLGQRLATCDPTHFLARFLAHYGLTESRGMVLDGVRHLGIWRAIVEHACKLGVPSCLIFVDTEASLRRARLLARGQSEEEIATWAEHIMEKELPTLKDVATVVVDGAAPIDDLLKRIRMAVAAGAA